MKLDTAASGVFGDTSPHSTVWFLRDGVRTILAREAGGARMLAPGVPAWVQSRATWGTGPDSDYTLWTPAGQLDAQGATEWTAGHGAYTAYLDSAAPKFRWSAAQPPPLWSVALDTDPETGLHVLVRDRQTGHGLLVCRPDGAVIADRSMLVSWARLRDGVLCVLTDGRLWLADVTSAGISNGRFVETLFTPYQPHAVRWRDRVWLVYHVAHEDRGVQNTLVVHPEDAFTGCVMAPAGTPTYGLDVRVFGDRLVVGYGADPGETQGTIHGVAAALVDLRSVVAVSIPVPADARPIWRGLTDPLASDPGNCLQGGVPAGNTRPVIDHAPSYPSDVDFRTLDRHQILGWYWDVQRSGELARTIVAARATGRPVCVYDDSGRYRATTVTALQRIRGEDGVTAVPWVQGYLLGETAVTACARITDTVEQLEHTGEREILLWRGLYTGSGAWPLPEVSALQVLLDDLIEGHTSIVADIAFGRRQRPGGGGLDDHTSLLDYYVRRCAGTPAAWLPFFGAPPVVVPPVDPPPPPTTPPTDPPPAEDPEDPMPLKTDDDFRRHAQQATDLLFDTSIWRDVQGHPAGWWQTRDTKEGALIFVRGHGEKVRECGVNPTHAEMVFGGIAAAFTERGDKTWPDIRISGSQDEARKELIRRAIDLDRQEGLRR